MHALHLPFDHPWRLGLVALGLSLVLLVLGALVAPAIVDVSAPTVTTVETTAGEAAPPPTWKTEPLAPPPLLAER
jgi:hypothetical protein